MIQRRGKTWSVRVYDRTAPSGKRWVGTFETEDEAQAAERAATVGLAASARARTVADWAIVWERDYARPAPATRRTYASALRRIVEDAGELRLDRVDRPTARRFATTWPRSTARVARTLFADAHRDGLIVAIPFVNLRLETPKGRKDLI